jgi:hypothetical protein
MSPIEKNVSCTAQTTSSSCVGGRYEISELHGAGELQRC